VSNSGENSTQLKANPLLNEAEHPDYTKIKAEHIYEAVEFAVSEARKNFDQLLTDLMLKKSDPSYLRFDTVIYPLIEVGDIVSRVWAPVSNLLSLHGTPEIRAAAQQSRPLIVAFNDDQLLDPRVYEIINAYAKTSDAKSLTGEQARLLSNFLRDLKLAGASLPEDKKAELRNLNIKLAELTRHFSDNVTDSKFELVLTNDADLKGLPPEVIKAAKLKADQYREKLGAQKIPDNAAIFNLDYPSYLPFMRYSERGDLRKTLSFEYLQQGSENARHGLLAETDKNLKSLDNKQITKEICLTYQRKAELLGFNNYAELGLTVKMARTPETVKSFLDSLAKKVKPIAQKEYNALVEFQKQINYQNTENNPNLLCAWDREFLAEKLRKLRFDYDSQETKPYFELRQTLKGIFSISEKLFGLRFEKTNDVPTWHQDVEVYKVLNEHGTLSGTLYLDLYPRDLKSQGAWLNPLRNSHYDSKGVYHPGSCVLVCNLTPPSNDQPSLLSYEEANTLFHEFGHGLHHLLSTVKLEPLGGLYVAYDFVELPSQLFENFCNEEESLKTFALHYKTKEVIPQELLNKILKARRFLAGIMAIRQLEFGLFDISIYTNTKPEEIDFDQQFKEIVEKYSVFKYWEGTHFPYTFTHIFAGGYSAGYYSYKWSEVLEADAFTKFKEHSVLNPEIGKKFRDTILSRGDSAEAAELFRDFMGRDAKEDALLEKLEDTI
jgi:oligopeptidase A